MTPASTAFRALGTTAEVLVTDPSRLGSAVELLHEELDAIDQACSRFRADSEISRLHEAAGREVRVGALLAEALSAALRAARLTGGLVDPTVGAAVRALGYDRDFALVTGEPASAGRTSDFASVTGELASAGRVRDFASMTGEFASARRPRIGVPDFGSVTAEPVSAGSARNFASVTGGTAVSSQLAGEPTASAESTVTTLLPAPGWHRVLFDPAQRLVVLPRGVHLDLGATAKALAADRAAHRIHAVLGCGTLVNLGGDLRTAGPAPDGGWQVALADDHAEAVGRPDTTVAVHTGGLATSGTTLRRWRHGGRTVHHIVDPRTGDVAEPRWRTVTVAAKSTVDANAASTAAIVLGTDAPDWLRQRRLPARLVGVGGDVVRTPGWPGEQAS